MEKYLKKKIFFILFHLINILYNNIKQIYFYISNIIYCNRLTSIDSFLILFILNYP